MLMSRREMLKAIAAGALLPDLLAGSQNVWAQTNSGTQALALTIGLDSVDPSGYGGWPGRLSGCENDANAYDAIARNKGFQTRRLRSQGATVSQVVGHILWAAKTLRSGDIFFVAYSGHGGQLPDRNGDETDGYDETWCLFDRQLIDDELALFWQYFSHDVRILLVSDSCHSGTVARVVARAAELQNAARDPKLTAHANKLLGKSAASHLESVANRAKALVTEGAGLRGMPAAIANRANLTLFRELPEAQILPAYNAQRSVYDGIAGQIRTGDKGQRDKMMASGVLLAACKDEQLSMEMGGRGLFSSVLERALGASPNSTYPQLIAQAKAEMPDTQVPQLFPFGVDDTAFQNQQAFHV